VLQKLIVAVKETYQVPSHIQATSYLRIVVQCLAAWLSDVDVNGPSS